MILILISPDSAPPEQHLKMLAELARKFLDAALVRCVNAAESAAEIVRLVRAGRTA